MGKTEYTITSVEDKETSKGDPMQALHLSNGDTVNIFQHHDRFGILGEGDKINQDELYIKSNGYTELKDQPGDSVPDSADPYEGKTNEMDEAMTRKERSIKVASTARMASQVMSAEIEAGHIGNNKMEKKDRWRELRTFFAGNWDAIDDEYTDPGELID